MSGGHLQGRASPSLVSESGSLPAKHHLCLLFLSREMGTEVEVLWSSWKQDVSLAALRSPRLETLLHMAMFPGWPMLPSGGHALASAQGEVVLMLGRGWVPPTGT